MRHFALAILSILIYVFVLAGLSAISSAFSQVDTLPKKEVKKDTPIVILEKQMEKKDQENAAIKDTIAQNLVELGSLKPKAEQNNAIIKVAENNLRQTILKSDGDVQAIENVYRIDTSPRPVVIQVLYPTYETPKRRGWLFKRD